MPSLLQAAALGDLWQGGFVEPITPPPLPYHLFAQQVLALALQKHGASTRDLMSGTHGLRIAASLSESACLEIIHHMLAEGILFEDSGILCIGPQGERLYSGKNYLNMLSLFDSPPLFTVYWGPKDIGAVHPISFHREEERGSVVLSLGGRSWKVGHIDWEHQTAQVTPVEESGKSRWLGESCPLSAKLCQAIRSLLLDRDVRPWWSKRATDHIQECRQSANQVAADGTVIEADRDREKIVWWTFAGLQANFELSAGWLGSNRFDNFSVTIFGTPSIDQVWDWTKIGRTVDAVHLDRLPRPKFHQCLPPASLSAMLHGRMSDSLAVDVARGSSLVYRTAG